MGGDVPSVDTDPVRWHFDESGCVLTINAEANGLDIMSQTTWADPALAKREAPTAIDEFRARLHQHACPAKTVIKHVGRFYVMTSVGPPTWWLPRGRSYIDGRGRRVVSVGWMRALLSVSRAAPRVRVKSVEPVGDGTSCTRPSGW